MTTDRPARTTARTRARTRTSAPGRIRRRRRVAALLVAAAAVLALAAALGDGDRARSTFSTVGLSVPVLEGEPSRALGMDDGAVPDGTTAFDDAVPGVANLDPDLLAALRRAAGDAAAAGVRLVVDSGWRSEAYQEHLLQEAVAKYGSREEAARWVATPGTSAHVSGDAVDVGPSDAASWLSAHGAAYGLCRIYANEPWHFEMRPAAVAQGCPAMYADAAHDPRLQG